MADSQANGFANLASEATAANRDPKPGTTRASINDAGLGPYATPYAEHADHLMGRL